MKLLIHLLLLFGVCADLVPEEQQVLSFLFQELGGAVGSWSPGCALGWGQNTSGCRWAGVFCDKEHVSQLDLGNCGLSGVLTESLCRLSKLTELRLNGNRLLRGSEAFLCIFALPSLSLLNLELCRLELMLPTTISAPLQELNINSNLFQGLLPLKFPPMLENLFMSGNSLNGTIASIASASNLINVDLSENAFTGVLPIFSPTVRVIQLSKNTLSGSIPWENFQQNHHLFQLDLSYNNFTSVVGSADVTNLTAAFINLENNQLIGDVFNGLELFKQYGNLVYYNVARNPRVKGVVTMDLLQQAPNLLLLDLSDTNVSAVSSKITYPSWIHLDIDSSTVHQGMRGLFECAEIHPIGAVTMLKVSPSLWNFSTCRCTSSSWGKPPDCPFCPEHAICNGSNTFRYKPNLFPVLNANMTDFSEFLECEGTSCNPYGTAVITYGLDSPIDEVPGVCDIGSSGRECSRCICTNTSSCFFSNGSRCDPCGGNTVAVIFSCIFVSLILLLFVCMPSMLPEFFLELAIVLVFLVFTAKDAWLIVIFTMLLMVLMFVQGLFRAKSGTFDSLSVVTFTGLAKVALFFLQTTSLLAPAAGLWPLGVTSAVHDLQRITGHLRGLVECALALEQGDSRELFAFISVMMMPFLLVGVALTLRLLVWASLRFKKWFKRRRIRRLKRKADLEEDAPSDRVIQNSFDRQSVDEHSFENRKEELGELPLISDEGNGQLFSNARQPHTKNRKTIIIRILMKEMLLVFYGLYYELATSILEALKCHDGYLSAHRWLSCDSPVASMMRVWAWVFFAVYVVGIPFIFGAIIFFHRHKGDPHHHWYSFLVENYNQEHRYFEIVWMLRRLLLTLSITVIDDRNLFQPFCVLFVILAISGIEARLQPFTRSFENILDAASNAVLLLTYSLSLLALDHNGSWSQLEPLKWTLFILQISLLSLFALVLLGQVAQNIFQHKRSQKLKIQVKDGA